MQYRLFGFWIRVHGSRTWITVMRLRNRIIQCLLLGTDACESPSNVPCGITQSTAFNYCALNNLVFIDGSERNLQQGTPHIGFSYELGNAMLLFQVPACKKASGMRIPAQVPRILRPSASLCQLALLTNSIWMQSTLLSRSSLYALAAPAANPCASPKLSKHQPTIVFSAYVLRSCR